MDVDRVVDEDKDSDPNKVTILSERTELIRCRVVLG